MSQKGTVKVAIVSKTSQYGFQIEGQKNTEAWFNYKKSTDIKEGTVYEKPEKGDSVEFDWYKGDEAKNATIDRIKVLTKREPIGDEAKAKPEGKNGQKQTQTVFYPKDIIKDTLILHEVSLKAATEFVLETMRKNPESKPTNETLQGAVDDLATRFTMDAINNLPWLTKQMAGAWELAITPETPNVDLDDGGSAKEPEETKEETREVTDIPF